MRAALLAGLVAVGCSSGSATPPVDAGPDSAPAPDAGPDNALFNMSDLAGACALNTRVGIVEISHTTAMGVSEGGLSATVQTAVPPLTGLETVTVDGSCAIYKKINPFCDPMCGLGMQCSLEETCIPMIRNLEAGTVTVIGLTEPVILDPNSNDYYQVPLTDVPIHLSNPPFKPGSRIRFVAKGGEVEGFELRGIGVEPTVVPTEKPKIDRDHDFVVQWEPGSVEIGAPVHLKVKVDQHAVGASLELHCDVSDVGTHTIPAALINKFLDGGISGFPSVDVDRHTADHVKLTPGCVEMRITSKRNQEVTVVGHTPCNAGNPCPSPLTCNKLTETCE